MTFFKKSEKIVKIFFHSYEMHIMTDKSVYKQAIILEMLKNLFEQALTDVKLEKQEKKPKNAKINYLEPKLLN